MTILKNCIESLRDELCLLIQEKELTDSQVIICSQELDSLLVKYEKCMSLNAPCHTR